jgi:asparagine synthase (glutamine-hydrolysing)
LCGIAGIVNQDNRPIDEAALHRMCDAMVHRGPDGAGYYRNSSSEAASANDGQRSSSVGLGIRRLAVIDLITGDQPIHNEDKTIWVVLNGEIYNYTELRAELEMRGHFFYTRSDTEVIVHAYEEYGCDTPKRLRGMFAFALWDERMQRLLLARDRVGKKPLLYSIKNGNLVFASEFQAILKHPDVSREINYEALHLYLSFAFVPAPLTAFSGVHKLEPGHLLVWSKGDARIQKYWSLDFTSKVAISEHEAAERAVQLIRDAVRARLMSDVALGAFLSGGIDSSAVVAFMSELSGGRVKTFSIGFEEDDYSELEHARRVAERFGTDHHEFVMPPDVQDTLPILVRHYGEPYADSSALPAYYLSNLARQHVTVALNGDGGDECFAGYERYAAMRIGEQYDRLPDAIKTGVFEPALSVIPESGSVRSHLARGRRLLSAMGVTGGERYLKLTSVISDTIRTDLCAQGFIEETKRARPIEHLRPWFGGNGKLDVVDRAIMADTAKYLPDDLLVKMDIASMAVSLEARSPFLDHHLMEFAASLPARLKLKGLTTKYILKRGLRGLVPGQNLNRAKMGLGVPIGRWFRGKLKGLLADVILSERAIGRGYFKPSAAKDIFAQHVSGRRDYGALLWTMMMMELWHREFID